MFRNIFSQLNKQDGTFSFIFLLVFDVLFGFFPCLKYVQASSDIYTCFQYGKGGEIEFLENSQWSADTVQTFRIFILGFYLCHRRRIKFFSENNFFLFGLVF